MSLVRSDLTGNLLETSKLHDDRKILRQGHVVESRRAASHIIVVPDQYVRCGTAALPKPSG